MKAIILLSIITFLFASNCYSQSSEKDKYIIKAKNQNTGAWSLALGGTVLHIAGFVLELSVPFIDLNATPEEQKSRRNKEKTAEVLLITGGVALVGCIPLFISSHINHKKSLHVAIDMKHLNKLKANNLYASYFPSLTLNIGL